MFWYFFQAGLQPSFPASLYSLPRSIFLARYRPRPHRLVMFCERPTAGRSSWLFKVNSPHAAPLNEERSDLMTSRLQVLYGCAWSDQSTWSSDRAEIFIQ